MQNPHWPLFDLRVRTPRLELRLPTDADLVELAAAAARGVHDPAWMPFFTAWSTLPPPELQRNIFRYHWRLRADWTPQSWSAQFAVVHDGAVIGTQGLTATAFDRLRTVDTGSWVERSRQGQGLGKEMVAASLFFAFEGAGADLATSGARADNAASIAVKRALGFGDNGTVRSLYGDQPVEDRRFLLTRERWEAHTRDLYDVRIEGFDACRDMFGA